MGIKDIPLSTTPLVPQGIPVPPSLESIIQTTKGQITNDPQSGSILKLLGENGFKEKIQEGYKNGKTYTILHAAPSPDFTLIESWTETTKDENGAPASIPRKNYQFFKIIVDTPPAEVPQAEVLPTEPAPELVVIAPTPAPTEKEPEPVTVPEVVTAPPTMIPTESPITDRALEVAQKIKRGGAGMTQEDWQYRNENWPAIEKHLMPALSEHPPAHSERGGEAPIAQEPTPTLATEQVATTPTPAAPVQPTPAPVQQHYDSKAWLMQKLGSPKATTPTQTTAPTPTTSSSYDILKARFAKTGTATPVQENNPVTTKENPDQRRTAFIQSIFANAPQEWEVAKTIPARAFVYPTEYAWGTDEQGNQVSRTLEDFPLNARKLREKVAQSIEELATQGVSIETISIEQALTDLFNKGIL